MFCVFCPLLMLPPEFFREVDSRVFASDGLGSVCEVHRHRHFSYLLTRWHMPPRLLGILLYCFILSLLVMLTLILLQVYCMYVCVGVSKVYSRFILIPIEDWVSPGRPFDFCITLLTRYIYVSPWPGLMFDAWCSMTADRQSANKIYTHIWTDSQNYTVH